MQISLTSQQAKVLIDLLFDEQIRASDRINNAQSDEQLEIENQRAKILDDLVGKVCIAKAKADKK